MSAGGTSDALALYMSDAAKAHDAKYADFAARMIAALAKEEADMARFNATLYVGAADMTATTVRPSKK